ncbi:coiled-coil domain-containing protein [Helicobacter pylori]|uniref:coiled-coil domain-containing protein n=1 Tax=Helicobacter pylori TaxID=210 RepID=UPI001E33BDC5|nr:hypothetical protein [Helicobacter pylori]
MSRLKTQLQEKEKHIKSVLGEIKELKQKVKEAQENIKKHQKALDQFEEWRDESQSNNPKNAAKMQEWMDERQEKIDDAQCFINKAQSWIKKRECTIDEILTHTRTIEPNYLLPQDFLYVGKLARVNKSEIYAYDGVKKSNIYGQRLSLAFGEHEKKLWDSYNSQEEFYILITWQNKEDSRFFKASLCKGLLYKHILEESVFEVSPKYKNAIDQKMTECLFHGIHLLLPIEYKEFKYKKYTPRDTFKVWVINYDSLLKSVFIAEKEPEPKHMDVIMLFNDRLGSQILKYAYIFNDSNLSYSVLDYQKNVLTLGVAHLMLKCRATPDHLVLQEIRELPKNFTEKLNNKIFPLERGITFVYEKEKERYDELAVARSVSVEDMLLYIQTQMRLSQHQELEYDPFKKWQQIIEHQIQTNSYTQVAYQSYTKNNHLYTFKIADSILIDRTTEAKVNGFIGEKAIQRTGKVIGGVDKTNNEICIKFKTLGVEFPQEGFLFLRTDYSIPLERQKRALERFNKNEIVNQDLKRFLLDPKIIFYTPLGHTP